jgi:hypothetical protein
MVIGGIVPSRTDAPAANSAVAVGTIPFRRCRGFCRMTCELQIVRGRPRDHASRGQRVVRLACVSPRTGDTSRIERRGARDS